MRQMGRFIVTVAAAFAQWRARRNLEAAKRWSARAKKLERVLLGEPFFRFATSSSNGGRYANSENSDRSE